MNQKNGIIEEGLRING